MVIVSNIILVVGLLAVGAAVFISIIRYSINTSKVTDKLDELVIEIRRLRRELYEQSGRDNGHHVDRQM